MHTWLHLPCLHAQWHCSVSTGRGAQFWLPQACFCQSLMHVQSTIGISFKGTTRLCHQAFIKSVWKLSPSKYCTIYCSRQIEKPVYSSSGCQDPIQPKQATGTCNPVFQLMLLPQAYMQSKRQKNHQHVLSVHLPQGAIIKMTIQAPEMAQDREHCDKLTASQCQWWHTVSPANAHA